MIQRLDQDLNQTISKMSIPYFDSLLGPKPKHPHVSALSQFLSLHLVAPPSQIPGLRPFFH